MARAQTRLQSRPRPADNPLVISANFSLPAFAGVNAISRATHALNRSMERLATGQRINRASDDPAGLIAAENLKAQERDIRAKIDALEQQEYYFGAREGASSVVSDLLVELQGLVTAAGNRDVLSDEERRGLQVQAESILQTIDFLGNTTTFKGQQVLGGARASAMGQVTREIRHIDGTTETLHLSLASLFAHGAINLVTGDLDAAQAVVDAAAGGVAGDRAAVGNALKSTDHERSTLLTQLEEILKAKSQILDTDYAKETAEFVRQQTLQQAALYTQQLAMNTNRTLIEGLLKPK